MTARAARKDEDFKPRSGEMYKFLGVEQADGIKTKQVYERVKEQMTKG